MTTMLVSVAPFAVTMGRSPDHPTDFTLLSELLPKLIAFLQTASSPFIRAHVAGEGCNGQLSIDLIDGVATCDV
jgi:hypothetical protein